MIWHVSGHRIKDSFPTHLGWWSSLRGHVHVRSKCVADSGFGLPAMIAINKYLSSNSFTLVERSNLYLLEIAFLSRALLLTAAFCIIVHLSRVHGGRAVKDRIMTVRTIHC